MGNNPALNSEVDMNIVNRYDKRNFSGGICHDSKFLGWIDQRPIHVVVSYDSANQILFIITAYEPQLKHFKPGFKVRRKR